MYSRAVDDAATELRELRHDEWGSFGLGALAIALALVATQVRPAFAIPLFVGGLAVAAGGVRAAWRHWDLLERLAGERDAYVIPEVRARACREATMERRQTYAALLRANACEDRRQGVGTSADAAREELEDLVADLLDDRLGSTRTGGAVCPDADRADRCDPARTPEELRSASARSETGSRPASR
jgi:hypothetical protein